MFCFFFFKSFKQSSFETVKTINIKIIIQDQSQAEVITSITKEIVHIPTLKIDIIRRTVLKIPHIIETKTTQTMGIDNTQIIDHETIQTKDQTMKIIPIDPVRIPIIKTLFTQNDKENILSHHIEIIHNTKIHNETIEVAHLNIKDKSSS